MHQLKTTEAHTADRDILRGPPGLLFGLTLLIFAAARLCFGWTAQVASADTEKPAVHAVQAEAEPSNAEPALTRADLID